MTVTPTVAQLAELAMHANLRPHTVRDTPRVLRMILNGRGPDSAFGSIDIGARSGRVLRGTLAHGDGVTVHRHIGPRGLAHQLRHLVHLAPDPGEPTLARVARTVGSIDLCDGDWLTDDLDLWPSPVSHTRTIPVLYGPDPGTGVKVVFQDGTHDILPEHLRLRVNRRANADTATATARPPVAAE